MSSKGYPHGPLPIESASADLMIPLGLAIYAKQCNVVIPYHEFLFTHVLSRDEIKY